MTPSDAMDIVQLAMWTTVVAATPAVLPAMLIGIAIALLQALTQVQEVTLTFVPKIMVVFFSIALGAGFIGGQIDVLNRVVFDRIVNGY